MRTDLTKYTKQTEVFAKMTEEITPIIKEALKARYYDEDEFDVNATYNDLGNKVAIAFDVTNKDGETVDAFTVVEVVTKRYNATTTKNGGELSAFDREKVEDLKAAYEEKKERIAEREKKNKEKEEKEERERLAREQARANKK